MSRRRPRRSRRPARSRVEGGPAPGVSEAEKDSPVVSFTVADSLGVPSRKDPQLLEIGRIELPAEYHAKAIPVLTPRVYRLAKLVNKSDLVILPGEATTYVGGQFAGRMKLPLVAAGEPFIAGFGVDPQVQISRRLVRKVRTVQGGNQVFSYEFRIGLRNYRPGPVKVELWDRLPTPEGEAVTVNLVKTSAELSNDVIYQRTGRMDNLLRWDLEVLAGTIGDRGSCNQTGGRPFSAASGFVLLAMDHIAVLLLGGDLMDFPIVDLMDQESCRRKLADLLHPEGLTCPRRGARDGLNVHRRRPDSPVVDPRCKACRRVFNMYTNTPWQGTHHGPARILLILRGIAKGEPTAKLAREVGVSRQHLLRLRHEIQARTLTAATHEPLPDDHAEADEMYQDAGEERAPHIDPDDPPRRRANQAKGHGTWETDRPPVPGVTGRESGRLWLRVGHRSTSAELVNATVLPAPEPGAMVYTDDWDGYNPLARRDRGHATVNHNRGEFARDDDGDGIREVHCNTMEGIWKGLRNFPRPFRGVNKAYLEQYVIMFDWSYNLKKVTDNYLRILIGAKVATELVT